MTGKVKFAKLSIELSGTRREILALESSLTPEAVRGKRFTFTTLRKNEGNTILLNFSAADPVSLRAGMNTILRLTLAALKSIRAVSDGS